MKTLKIKDLQDQILDPVYDQVRIQTWNKVRDQVLLQTRRQASDQVWAYVQNQVWSDSPVKMAIIFNLNEKI